MEAEERLYNLVDFPEDVCKICKTLKNAGSWGSGLGGVAMPS